MARKPESEIDPNDKPDAYADLASTSGIEDKATVESLLQQVADLKAKLNIKDEALTEANKRALAAAESQASFQQSSITEVPSGRTRKIEVLDVGNEEWPTGYKTVSYKEDGRPNLKPQFRLEAKPTYYYKIDLPPMAGWDMKINNVPIVHGGTYEVDLGTLQFLKDQIARAWNHEAVTTGSRNENLFRKPLEKRIGSRA